MDSPVEYVLDITGTASPPLDAIDEFLLHECFFPSTSYSESGYSASPFSTSWEQSLSDAFPTSNYNDDPAFLTSPSLSPSLAEPSAYPHFPVLLATIMYDISSNDPETVQAAFGRHTFYTLRTILFSHELNLRALAADYQLSSPLVRECGLVAPTSDILDILAQLHAFYTTYKAFLDADTALALAAPDGVNADFVVPGEQEGERDDWDFVEVFEESRAWFEVLKRSLGGGDGDGDGEWKGVVYVVWEAYLEVKDLVGGEDKDEDQTMKDA